MESLFWGRVRRRSDSDEKGTRKRYTRRFSTTARTSSGVICSEPRHSRLLLPDRKPTDLTPQFILPFCLLSFFLQALYIMVSHISNCGHLTWNLNLESEKLKPENCFPLKSHFLFVFFSQLDIRLLLYLFILRLLFPSLNTH